MRSRLYFVCSLLAVLMLLQNCSSSNGEKPDEVLPDTSSDTTDLGPSETVVPETPAEAPPIHQEESVDLTSYFNSSALLSKSGTGALIGQMTVGASVNLALPASAIPTAAIPAAALPASALATTFLLVPEDPEENKPAAGVDILLLDAENNERAHTTTDENGIYAFNEIEAGEYSVVGNVEDQEGTILAIRQDNIQVVAGNIVNLSTLTLAQTGAIKGLVTLTGLEEHTGIEVYIAGTSFTGRTDQDGRFILLFLPEGTYDLTFNRHGFEDQVLTKIAVTAKRTTSTPAVVLEQLTGTLTGKVVRYDADAHGQSTVSLNGTSEVGTTVEQTVATAADGSYHFEDIPIGVYELTASRDGYFPERLVNRIIKAAEMLEVETLILSPRRAIALELAAPEALSLGTELVLTITLRNRGAKEVRQVIPTLELIGGEDLQLLEDGLHGGAIAKLAPDQQYKVTYRYTTAGEVSGVVNISIKAEGYPVGDETAVIDSDEVEAELELLEPGRLLVSSINLPSSLLPMSANVPIAVTVVNNGGAPVLLDHLVLTDTAGAAPLLDEAGAPLVIAIGQTLAAGETLTVQAIARVAAEATGTSIQVSLAAVDGLDLTTSRDLPASAVTATVGYATWFQQLPWIELLGEDFGTQWYTHSVAWTDFDKDGLVDVLLGMSKTEWSGPSLMRNNGDGTFEDVYEQADDDYTCSSPVYHFFDYDNDGDQDLLVTGCRSNQTIDSEYGRAAEIFLLQNDGLGNFTEMTCAAGAEMSLCDYFFAFGAGAVADLDGDNWLDFALSAGTPFETYYTDESMVTMTQEYFIYGLFFHNQTGDDFDQIASELGVDTVDFNGGWDAPFADYDNDGYPDVFTCEYRESFESRLLHNLDGTHLSNRTQDLTTSPAMLCYTVGWGDYNGDGFLDLFVGSLNAADDRLYRNRGDGTFEEVKTQTGINRSSGSSSAAAYCTLWFDFDNDGDLDLFEATTTGNDFLYINRGDGTFETAGTYSGLPGSYATACAAGDYDGDGDLDIMIGQGNNNPNPPYLLRNRAMDLTGNHYLRIVPLTDRNGDATDLNTTDDRPAVGAIVWVDLDGDGDFATTTLATHDRLHMQQLGLGHPYQNEPVVHVGLGSALQADVKVRFPDGSVVIVENVTADQTLEIADILD